MIYGERKKKRERNSRVVLKHLFKYNQHKTNTKKNLRLLPIMCAKLRKRKKKQITTSKTARKRQRESRENVKLLRVGERMCRCEPCDLSSSCVPQHEEQ